MRWPVHRQIMLPLLAVAALSLTAVGALNAHLAWRDARDRIERRLERVVDVLTTTNFPLSDVVLRQMRELSSAEFALTDGEGRPLASSLEKPPVRLPTDAGEVSSSEGLGASLAINGENYFHRIANLPPRAREEEIRKLHVLFPEREYRRSWREAIFPSVAVGLATLAAVAIVARVLAGRISRATKRLGDEVLRIARGDFAAAPLPSVDDEIRDLAAAINRTAEMLSIYEKQIRQTEQMRTVALLGAGLAHEVRNAATGCRMALDLHAESCNGQGDAESLAVAKNQLRLMERQLQRFLQIGKGDPAAATQARRDVDLVKLIDELVALVRPTARHGMVDLQWRPPDHPVAVRGTEDELAQVVLNLVLNALEAARQVDGNSSDKRRVSISVHETDVGDAEMVICDSGPGPAAEMNGAIFEPFVTSKAEGAGLGLAVAQQVVESHRGVIDWRREQGVTRFCVTLPLATKE